MIRILLSEGLQRSSGLIREVEQYSLLQSFIAVNLYSLGLEEQEAFRSKYQTNEFISFESFDPFDPQSLLSVVQRNNMGFDVIVSPAQTPNITSDTLQNIARNHELKHKLRLIACPNDSISHLVNLYNLAKECGITILNTPGVHARSVAEYTIFQIGFHARNLNYFYSQTGLNGLWPHYEAICTNHLLEDKVLGVMGGSGKDGAAVIALAMKLGMRVIAINSGSPEGLQKMQRLGAEIAENIEELLRSADYISINCRVTDAMHGVLGEKQIASMKPGVIIINPAGADVFDRHALIQEFCKPALLRRIGALVLDMPFGGRRDSKAFEADPSNELLKNHGVLFTPRIAGYTVESRKLAVAQLIRQISSYFSHQEQDASLVNHDAFSSANEYLSESYIDFLCADIVEYVREAGDEALKLRNSGLITQYKEDGSPITKADIAVETIIKDRLRGKGYLFRFIGEDTSDEDQSEQSCEIVIDGIDGTRNFRDGNYGWCISVGVSMNGRTVIGVIHDPQSNETYHAISGKGAFVCLNGATKQCKVPESLPADFSFSIGSFRIAGSSTKKANIIDDIKNLGGRGREWGSIALSICAVARGGLGTFIQGNSKRHDRIAAILIAQEAGASVSIYEKEKNELPDIVVSHPTIASNIQYIYNMRTRDG